MSRHLLWILTLAAGCATGPAEKGRVPEVAGKPVAPIRLEDTEAISDGAGQVVDVEIAFTLLRDAEGITLEITPEEGMTVVSPATSFALGAGTRDETFTRKVTVRPDEEGAFFLNVLVSGLFDGLRMARAGTVPVRTSPDARREIVPRGRIGTAADGTRILERPIGEKPR